MHSPPEAEPAARGSALEWGLRLALVLAAACAGVGAALLWSWGDALVQELGRGYWPLLLLQAGAALLALVALADRRPPRSAPAPLLRLGFVLAVATQTFLVAWLPEQREPLVAGSVGLAAGLFALLVLASARGPTGRRAVLGRAERALFGLALALCGAELVLRLVAALFQPALLAEASDVSSWIASHRLRPGSVRLGFPVSSRGFYDVEPPTERGSKLVGVIGDSFSVGAVPHSLHYTSIAEAELPGWEFYNAGVAGADPRHYLTLLTDEVLPLRPDLVVVAVFVGNDLILEESAPVARGGALRWVGERRASVLARLVLRLERLRREAERQAAAGVEAASGDDGLVPPERVAAEFPWVVDPLLETPTFSEQAFLQIERERVLATTAPTDAYPAFAWLEEIRARCADVPLLLLLIPDEFQVEDEVWRQATAGLPGTPVRDAPQEVLARFCAERGIASLDLLPVLRAEPPLADGRRHLYALRDTHWNARGNALAGRELARAAQALLAR